uniref:Uncharacterized protein n=1 Tax=Romanomermis culicivorax TaxID=13658 RepID=A0A915J1T0_ROMCU
MKGAINQVAAAAASPTASPLASKSPSARDSKTGACLASLGKQASVGGKLIGADKKKGYPSSRILKSGSALFVAAKKNAAFSPDKKMSKISFPASNFPSQSLSKVKLVAFPKMNKVVVFNKQKDAELAARVKLDMKSALKDRTDVQSCFSVQSYEPNDQSEGGISLRGGNKPNLFGDDLLAASVAANAFHRPQSNFLSPRAKNICIIVSIVLILLIGLIFLIITISILLSSSAPITDDDSFLSSVNLNDTIRNLSSSIENTTLAATTTARMKSSKRKSFVRKLKPSKENTIK